MIMRSITALSVAVGLGLATGPGLAQQPTEKPAAKQPMQHASGSHSHAAMEEYTTSMAKMQKAMMGRNDADPDRAWALKMIEHHRGAISMSEILAKHGDDAEAKRMAQKGSDMQKKEIAELESWLERHGGKPQTP